MEHCCSKKSAELEIIKQKQSKILYIVMLLNLAMFFIEMYSGLKANSTSILSDSLDMLGDFLVYAFSLYVIDKNTSWKISASLTKALIMSFFGIFVFGKIIYQVLNPIIPIYQTMGIIGGLALLTNIVCFFMLYNLRNQDTNMKSTWMCSRNDIIANISVLFATLLVSITNSMFPDIIVGIIITILFLSSSFQIFKIALNELKETKNELNINS